MKSMFFCGVNLNRIRPAYEEAAMEETDLYPQSIRE